MDDAVSYLNEVRLRGRLAAEPEKRVLPSGDELVTMRLVVGRPPQRAARGTDRAAPAQRTIVDTLDVACWTATARRAAGRLVAGDVVEVEGELRRRFFRAGGGAASRYEVEARALRKARAPKRAPTPG